MSTPDYLTPEQVTKVYPFLSLSRLAKSRIGLISGPKCIRLSERKIVYRSVDIDAWIASCEAATPSTAAPLPQSTDTPRKRRGRPTKAEVIARRNAQPHQ